MRNRCHFISDVLFMSVIAHYYFISSATKGRNKTQAPVFKNNGCDCRGSLQWLVRTCTSTCSPVRPDGFDYLKVHTHRLMYSQNEYSVDTQNDIKRTQIMTAVEEILNELVRGLGSFSVWNENTIVNYTEKEVYSCLTVVTSRGQSCVLHLVIAWLKMYRSHSSGKI